MKALFLLGAFLLLVAPFNTTHAQDKVYAVKPSLWEIQPTPETSLLQVFSIEGGLAQEVRLYEATISEFGQPVLGQQIIDVQWSQVDDGTVLLAIPQQYQVANTLLAVEFYLSSSIVPDVAVTPVLLSLGVISDGTNAPPPHISPLQIRRDHTLRIDNRSRIIAQYALNDGKRVTPILFTPKGHRIVETYPDWSGFGIRQMNIQIGNTATKTIWTIHPLTLTVAFGIIVISVVLALLASRKRVLHNSLR